MHLRVPMRQLYGVGPPLAFVIDTTGSMGTVIASVRSDAIAIVNSRRETDDAPGYYVLSQINDPALPSAQVYPDADSFITAYESLEELLTRKSASTATCSTAVSAILQTNSCSCLPERGVNSTQV